MTTGVLQDVPAQRADAAARRWEPLALLGILLLAAAMYCWGIGDRALQPYYAAAVHAMTDNAHAFLYAGFDPTGLFSIDKTPFAFWVQGLGVWVFGYHWWAIALVQAIEGVAAVFVLHRVVRRWAGERPALLAALFLAVSPISTAIDRVNQADALMVLLLLLAAYAVTRAVERAATGRGTGWLLAAGAFVGLAFFAKMLAGWIVLPALALAYLAAPISWPKRLLRLLAAGVVAGVVSLAWPVFVSLTPAADRPFVASTTNDSIWTLIFGYNGFGRVSGGSIGSLGNIGNLGSEFAAGPGVTRLFGASLGGQIGWLLPLALLTAIGALIVWARTRGGSANERAGWLLWGGWLVVAGLVFSFAGGIFHRYYTVELAPAIAALAAVGLRYCWSWYRAGRAAGLLLPLAVAGTAAYAYLVLDATPDWQPWLRPAIAVLGAISVLALLLAFPGRPVLALPTRLAALLGILVIVAGPLAYSVDTVFAPQSVIDAADPSAGPSTTDVLATAEQALGTDPAARLYVQYMADSATLTPGQREVLDYVTAHAPDARVQLAVELGSWGADPFLVNSTARVAAFGGYIGLDPAPTTAQLGALADSGQLGFVLFPGPLLTIGRAGANTGTAARSKADVSTAGLVERIGWVTKHCRPIPPSTVGPAAASAGILFACSS